MTANELEYRIKLNMLRIKYSNNPMEVLSLCIDCAISAVEHSKKLYRAKQLSKYPEGGIAFINENNKPEIIQSKKQ